MKMAVTSRQESEMKMKYQRMKYDQKASPLERLRAHVLCKGVCSLKVLSQAFKRMDRNGDGRIDLKEFQSALHEEGIVADEATERKCFSQMDASHSGGIDYEEFIAALKPPMSMNRKALVLQVFRKLDKDNNGVITTDDLKDTLNPKKHIKYISGEWGEDQVLQNFLQSFSGPGKQFLRQITLEDFENYYAGVSASTELDCHFDLIMRQAWKL